MSEHVWTQENLAALVAGGLAPDERERLERHLAECAGCSRAAAAARGTDRRLMALFQDVRPSPALEDRLVHGLRRGQQRPVRRLSAPGWIVKGLLASAAVALIAVLGGGITMMLDEAEQADRSASQSPEIMSGYSAVLGVSRNGLHASKARQEQTQFWTEVEGLAADTTLRPNYRSFTEDGKALKADELAKEIRKHSVLTLGKQYTGGRKGNRESFEAIDVDAAAQVPDTDIQYMAPNKSKVTVPGATPDPKVGILDGRKPSPPTYFPLPVMVGGTGQGGAADSGKEGREKEPAIPGIDGVYLNINGSSTASVKEKQLKAPDKLDGDMKPGPIPVPSVVPVAPPAPVAPPSLVAGNPTGQAPPPPKTAQPPQGTSAGPRHGYFQPGKTQFALEFQDGLGRGEAGEKKVGELSKKEGDKETPKEKTPAKEPPKTEKVDPPAEPDLGTGKIIIRTGEMDFEVDSFDSAVSAIQKLVAATKGGYVATINSDKLANGKVRGSVAVRVPPGQLDRLVLDLRATLGKAGDLKGQRIGSQDITKQYTDMLSRLKAARTMEDRLLKIIKDGKGEIKDLILAEKELGVWHTKIEELEGELRYYGNLVSLSTLTINLAEKEIHVAATVSESERVQAGVEVEDVEKAMRDVLKAVEEAKGRVTQSELKQHAAGQLNAILVFEVAPDSAGLIRDRLKQLGTVARLEIDRVQTAEGGTKLPEDGKLQRGSTKFRVSLYNLANIAPRETVTIRVAADDVPAAYRALRDAVTKVKGRVISADLRVQDQQNVGAQFDFDVRRVDEGGVQAALGEAGDVLSRQVARVADSENVTDTKVRFNVQLLAATSIPTRETVTMRVAAADVPEAYRTLRDMAVKTSARIFTSVLQQQDKRGLGAQLDFNIRRTEEGQFLASLTVAGDILSRHVARTGEGENVSDKRVLYKVEFVAAASIQPRETVTMKVAAADVPAAFRAVRDALTKADARVLNADLQEQDRQNISAQLTFDVQRKEEAGVTAALNTAADVIFRQVSRAPESDNVTDKRVLYKMDIVPATAIEPREIVGIAIEVGDVENALAVLNAQVKELQGRVVRGPESAHEQSGRVSALVVYDVPLTAAPAVGEKLRNIGQVRASRTTPNPQAPEGKLAIARFNVTLANIEPVVPRDEGVWATSRAMLAKSFHGLSVSLTALVVGALFVIPWLVVIAVVVWLARRIWRPAPTVEVAATPPPPTMPPAASA